MAENILGYQEQVIYHYILDEQIYLQLTKPEYFSNEIVRELFSLAKEHALKYKEAPSKEQILEIINIKSLGEKIYIDLVTSLYNTKQLLSQYSEDWLKENTGAWIQMKNLDNVMRKSIAYMKTTKINAENASEVVQRVRSMVSNETAIDFNFDLGSDFFDAKNHMQTRLSRMSTGYSFLDTCLKGGWWKGGFFVLMGAGKSGKSMILCNLAGKAMSLGKNVAYITLELQRELLAARIGSNLLNVPIDDYEKIVEDQSLLKQKLNEFKSNSLIPVGELHIKEFPASTASTIDIENYLKKAQELLGYTFDIIIIDYINIMKNWRNPNSENTYMKIKQISEDMRAMGMINNWAMLTCTQTNRNGINNSNLQITDIAESAGLLHTVDALFGIITDPIMKANGEYFISCLADRVAPMENMKKRYTFDRKYLKLEEDKNSQIQDMTLIIPDFYPKNNFSTKRNFQPNNNDKLINSDIYAVPGMPGELSPNSLFSDETKMI